ncbi:MAG: FHA domain-containing protein [Actinomycetes bacterium]
MSSDDDPGAGTGAAEPRPPRAPDAGPSEMTSTLSLGSAEVEPEGGGADPDQAAVEALPEGSALLVVRRGPNAGSRFVLDVDMVTAGRHPDSDIFLDDVTVSRRHAQFVRLGSGYAVKDVGSLNGTYVNRHRIDEAQLAGGDEVQIGKYRLVYLVGPSGSGGQP